MIRATTGKPGEGMRFFTHCPRCGAPTSVAGEAYCANSDCRWNNDDGSTPVRPSASQESASRPLRAPRAVKAQGATLSRPNWAQMALDLPSSPARS